MEVVLKEKLIEQVGAAINAALESGREIEKVVLTLPEWQTIVRQCQAPIISPYKTRLITRTTGIILGYPLEIVED